MRFLADESCDYAIVRALRRAGHDVLGVSEFQQRSVDSELMHLAYAERRILITEDKDFGWLAFVANLDSPGVVLVRFPTTARPRLAASFLKLVENHGDGLTGAFVVLQPGSVRFSRTKPGLN